MKLKINSLDHLQALSDAQEKTHLCINGVQVYIGTPATGKNHHSPELSPATSSGSLNDWKVSQFINGFTASAPGSACRMNFREKYNIMYLCTERDIRVGGFFILWN